MTLRRQKGGVLQRGGTAARRHAAVQCGGCHVKMLKTQAAAGHCTTVNDHKYSGWVTAVDRWARNEAPGCRHRKGHGYSDMHR